MDYPTSIGVSVVCSNNKNIVPETTPASVICTTFQHVIYKLVYFLTVGQLNAQN